MLVENNRSEEATDSGRPLLIFFLIAVGIPWIGWTALTLLKLDWGSPSGQLLFYTGLACSIGGIIATFAQGGGGAVRGLFASAVKWQFHPVWWVFAVVLPLIMICSAGTVYGVLTRNELVPPDFSAMENWASLAALLIIIPGPIGEEFGWRGFLFPHLLKHMGFLSAAVLTGVIWAVWHVPLYWGRLEDGGLTWLLLFSAGVVGFSVLMAVLLEATGSLMIVIVMHFVINLSQNWTFFPSFGGDDAIGLLITYVAVTWIIVALVLLRRRVRLKGSTS